MPQPRASLPRLVDALQRHHGKLPAVPPHDPWHAILWDNVVYLADDEHRQAAFARLRKATRLDAAVIARAPDEVLAPICGLGRMGEQCITKLRECAQCFTAIGDPRQLVALPQALARKALRSFPGVGAPGAHRLLLFARAQPLVALESNGLRTLLRLGYGQPDSSYAASYRSAVAAAGAELAEDCEARIALYQVMRRHGQQVCRATPACAACPVAPKCPSRGRAGAS